ncbi:MAG: hypothetical protein JO336_06935 [Acidobacteriia bacterium]|nr:hypothetical protein [Terriglobia bacterium]MBV8903443.1 hypothetical protein [Terriglobia bacterium]
MANRGLAAATLILLLAFTLCSAFVVHCHSKLVRLYSYSALEVTSQLRRSLAKLPPNIGAPD